MPWRCEGTSPERDPGGHLADSAAGQSGIRTPSSPSRFDPRVLPSRRLQGEATFLKLNNHRFIQRDPDEQAERDDRLYREYFGTLDPSVVASTSAASFQHDFRNGAVYYYSGPHGVNIHACYAAYADFLNHL